MPKPKKMTFNLDKFKACGGRNHSVPHESGTCYAMTIPADGFDKLVHITYPNGGSWTHQDFIK